jgi:hypothetical protein
MLSKEIGAVGIGLVALHDLLLPERRPRNDHERRHAFGLYAGYVALLVAFILVHTSVAGRLPADQIPFIDNPLAQAPPLVRWATATAVLGKGLLLQLLPLRQSADYSYNAIPLVESLADWRFMGGLAAVGFWLWLGFHVRRTAPAGLLSAGWYLITLMPAANLAFPVGTIFGERLLYAPSVGFALFAGWVIIDLIGKRRPRAQVAVVGGLAVVFAAGTVRYASAWGDELKLFTIAADHYPTSTKAHLKRAEILLKLGRAEEALREGRIAYGISRENDRAGILVAEVLLKRGDLDEAESILG